MKQNNILRTIKDVVINEYNTIGKLINLINGEYLKAVKLIIHCKGKVVLTGVGKSGIIAKKIASTMASTGTPAIYMHPTEGMHGDLGLVRKSDCILAIGKSGESTELLLVLDTIKKIGAKVIAITANKNSSLAKKSDVILYMDVQKEACPLNLAPTSSTTAALVIGDALAVALMELRNFKKTEFALYHPGGLLGKKLSYKVKDIMRTGHKNPVIGVGGSVKKMLCIMTEKMAGAVSVVGVNNQLLGLITDYDIRKIIQSGKNIYNMRVEDIMNPNPIKISKTADAISALELMEKRERQLSLMPVVDKHNRLIGLIHVHDIMLKGI